jgi:phosphoadenosine phosphosulfate reductase
MQSLWVICLVVRNRIKNPKSYSYEKFSFLTKYSLDQKIEWANEVISKAKSKSSCPAVSFSWGKDSIVLLDLVRKQIPDCKVIFADTGVEYPETYDFIENNKSRFGLVDGVNYFVAKGDKSFWQIVKSDGYPKPRQNACQDHVGVKKYRAPKCCLVLKERPLIKLEKKLGVDLIFWGIQATESMNRRLLFLTRGEFYYNVTEKRFKVSPLMIFTDKDIFEYCKLNDLPLPSIYSKMKRNGCMFCTAFLSWEKAMESYDPKIYSGFKLVKDNFEAKNL